MKQFKYLNSLKTTTFCTQIDDVHMKMVVKRIFGSCFLLRPIHDITNE